MEPTVHTKTDIFTHFDDQYLVLFTIVLPLLVGSTRSTIPWPTVGTLRVLQTRFYIIIFLRGVLL